ncbi:proton channel OtopLc-like [Glandiceps talaboti]
MKMTNMLKTHEGQDSHQAASVYIKGGAAVFGICSMLIAGFKLGSVIDGSCIGDCGTVDAAEAILSVLYILLLWLFVCVYSNKCITKWKRFARVGIMLLWATSVSCWSRDFVAEVEHDIRNHSFDYSNCNITHTDHGHINDSLIGTGLNLILDSANELGVKYQEVNFNSVEKDSSTLLYSGAMEFYLIMSGFMYVMYGNIGHRSNLTHEDSPKHRTLRKSIMGLGLGLLVLVTSIVVLVTHSIYSSHLEAKEKGLPSLIYNSFGVCRYPLSILGNVVCHLKMRRNENWKIDNEREDGLRLTMLLLYISASGCFINSTFTIIACIFSIGSPHEPKLLIVHENMKIVDIFFCVIFLYDALHRKPPMEFKPNFTREIIMFLIFVNFVCWYMDIYDLKASQVFPIQNCFYGFGLWSIIIHLTTPLLIYFRFHALLLYFEVWLSG